MKYNKPKRPQPTYQETAGIERGVRDHDRGRERSSIGGKNTIGNLIPIDRKGE